jgi:hypothetical protein
MSDSQPGTSVAPAASSQRAVRQYEPVEDVIPILDTARFEHMQRIATIMAASSLIPDSLRKDKDDFLPPAVVVSNCFMIVNQAVRWEMDPFAVAQSTSVVRGRLMYEGKLVAAVIEKRAKTRLSYAFGKWNPKTETVDLEADGEGDLLGVVVSGTLPGSNEVLTIEGAVGIWKTTGDKSPWRAGAFKRQLRYRGAREWARAHSPGVMLGVITDDEVDELEERRERTRSRRPTALTAGFGDAPEEKTEALAAPAEKTAEQQKPTDLTTETAIEATESAETATETAKPATEDTAPDTANTEVDADRQDHLDMIRNEGVEAAKEGLDRSVPDDLEDDDEAAAWLAGFDEARAEQDRAEAEARQKEKGKPEASSTESDAGDSDFPGDKTPEQQVREKKAAKSEKTSTAFTKANEDILKAEAWGAILDVLRTLGGTEEYQKAGDADKSFVRGWAWDRYTALRDEGKEALDVTQNLVLFRFWLEFGAEEIDQVDSLFRTVWKSDAYRSANEDSKRLVGDALTAAKERIKERAS